VVGLFVLAVLVRPQAPLLPTGSTAPSIQLRSTSGRLLNANAAAAHHALIVEFIEASCVTCQQKAPVICTDSVAFSRDLFVMIGAGGESAQPLTDFAARYLPRTCAVTLLVDPMLQATHAYQAAVVPTVYIVDAQGRIAYSSVAASGIDGVAPALQKIDG